MTRARDVPSPDAPALLQTIALLGSFAAARLTAAGAELVRDGARLLQDMDTVANRIKRVATRWESQITIAVDVARPSPGRGLQRWPAQLESPATCVALLERYAGV